MAVKISGTTVIDDGREIKNAFTVYQSNANGAVFWGNFNTISANTTLANTHNHMSIGPLTVNSGVEVTVNAGATWVIV